MFKRRKLNPRLIKLKPIKLLACPLCGGSDVEYIRRDKIMAFGHCYKCNKNYALYKYPYRKWTQFKRKWFKQEKKPV